MFASLKVRGDDKRQFDRLLHEVALQSGENLSQHELFHRILEHALRAKHELGAAPPKTRSWSRYQFDLGEATDAAAELDREVYGLDR